MKGHIYKSVFWQLIPYNRIIQERNTGKTIYLEALCGTLGRDLVVQTPKSFDSKLIMWFNSSYIALTWPLMTAICLSNVEPSNPLSFCKWNHDDHMNTIDTHTLNTSLRPSMRDCMNCGSFRLPSTHSAMSSEKGTLAMSNHAQ